MKKIIIFAIAIMCNIILRGQNVIYIEPFNRIFDGYHPILVDSSRSIDTVYLDKLQGKLRNVHFYYIDSIAFASVQAIFGRHEFGWYESYKYSVNLLSIKYPRNTMIYNSFISDQDQYRLLLQYLTKQMESWTNYESKKRVQKFIEDANKLVAVFLK